MPGEEPSQPKIWRPDPPPAPIFTDDPTVHELVAARDHHRIQLSRSTLVPEVPGSKRDENLLEIKGNPALAGAYFAEFMRLYNHYRARALWEAGGKPERLVLKTTRDEWAKKADPPRHQGGFRRVR
jgi:hypothetical protein